MTHPAFRRLDAVRADLRTRGFSLDVTEWETVARGESTDLTDVDAPLHVVRLRDDRPLTVVSAVANAAREGRVPVLTGDDRTLAAAEELLAAPFALADDGPGRRFRAIEDRIRLTDDTFAAVADREPLSWTETAGAGDGDRTGTDSPRLTLSVDSERVAVLDSVDALACPGPSPTAFPYRYERDDDGRIRLFDRDGPVGHLRSFGALRDDGYRPVPAPLVPEHHVRTNGRLARRVLLAGVDADGDGATVSYDAP